MTRDDIIRMAKEFGLHYRKEIEEVSSPSCDGVFLDDLECFIELAVAAEREACAKVCDGYWPYNGSASECAAAIRARGEK